MIHNGEQQNHNLERALDIELIAEAKDALESGKPVRIAKPIRNINRTVGAMLSGRVAEKYGHAGLPDGTISIRLKGVAGQSFGVWNARQRGPLSQNPDTAVASRSARQMGKHIGPSQHQGIVEGIAFGGAREPNHGDLVVHLKVKVRVHGGGYSERNDLK
mgnify:CR=1 FL=1